MDHQGDTCLGLTELNMERLAWPEPQRVDGYGVSTVGLASVDCLFN